MRSAVKAVFFDAGNTLLTQDYAVLAAILAGLGLPAAPADVRNAEHRARVHLDRHLRAGRSTEDPATIRFYRDAILREADPAGRVDPDAFWARIQEQRKRVHPYAQADAEAADAARALRAAGFRLGIISNADGSLAGLLSAAGLAPLFDVAIDSHVVGVEKPSREIFHLACRQAKVTPEEAVHIGDLPWIDAEAAAAAGLAGWTLDPGDLWTGHPQPRASSLSDFVRRLVQS